MRIYQRYRNRKFEGKGFTLIEVMIVLAVISILAIVTVPKYQATQDQYKLESAAQTVVTELRYAKQLAMDQRTHCFVVFREDEFALMKVVSNVAQEVEIKPYEAGVRYDPLDNSSLTDITYEGVPLGKGFKYDPKGFATYNGTVILKNSRGRTVKIAVAPETGIVSIVWP